MEQASGTPQTRRVYLHAITYLARDTNAYEFRAVGGGALAPFTAGAHVDLILPNGVRRSYSLCNSQSETSRYVIGVKKASPSRGGSAFVHEQLRVGMEIEIAAPRNNFPLIETAAHSVLIAGGIGVTPVWGMVLRLIAIGASWELHYASRTRADAAFLVDLQAMAGLDPLRLRLTFDHEPGGKLLDLPAIVAAAPGDAHFYACGPAPMLEAVRALCAERAIPAQLALESGMACGFGACFGCVVPRRGGGYLRVCVDGPVIDAAELQCVDEHAGAPA
jgi:vanillate O-demethylase ferredoxin subunit